MSSSITTTEYPHFNFDINNNRKPPKTWRDHCPYSIDDIRCACGYLALFGIAVILAAVGVAGLLTLFVCYVPFIAVDHVFSMIDAPLKVWLYQYWFGLKALLWAGGSAALMTCSLVLLAHIVAALMVITGGQLMECLANGGMLSMNDAVKENDWTMGVFNSAIYNRQIRIDTVLTAHGMLLSGLFGIFLIAPVCYKVVTYGAVFFAAGPPPSSPNNDVFMEASRTEARTDPKEHLAFVQSAIDRLVAEKKEAELQLAKERAQHKQLEDLFQKYFNLANPASRET
ncbi:hypothetical protein BG000_005210 [Podila horticola]|nr:hypothetical protein BG000_005210 [Podila horticola]